MGITISTHGGSTYNLDHNRRTKKVVQNQTHIEKSGWHESWYDADEREIYKSVFSQAQHAYNRKTKRKDRQIDCYYEKVKKDGKLKTGYELIVGIGSRENPVDPKLSYSILRKWFAGWKNRNPNFRLLGCHWHADEPDAQAHLHVTYLPFADGYKQGIG